MPRDDGRTVVSAYGDHGPVAFIVADVLVASHGLAGVIDCSWVHA